MSRLEALVDSLLEEKTERSVTDTSSARTPNTHTTRRDTFTSTPLSSVDATSAILQNAQRAPSERGDRGHHIPILSVFEDAVCGLFLKTDSRAN